MVDTSVSTATRSSPKEERRTRLRGHHRVPRQAWVIFSGVFAATLLQPTGVFLFDARGYWSAAGSILGSAEQVPEGFWDLRGVASAAIFLPAQAITKVIGQDGAGFAVLLQNSLLIAAVAAFLVPALVAPWARLGIAGRWVGAAAVAFATRGFAPYPLVDLYAAVAVLVAAWLLYRRSWLSLVSAGLMLGLAFNIRPAYLAPAILMTVVAGVFHRLRTAGVAIGAALALTPEAIYLAATHHIFGLTPIASSALVGLQTSYASYTIRYDTALTSPTPQQFFCSPTMARAIDTPPLTVPSLAGTFVENLPHSAVFALEKIGAALHWPLSIPYLVPNAGVNAVVAVLVTISTVAGIVRLLSLRQSPTGARIARPLISALVLAVTATLVSAASEARFALPLVLVGAIGMAVLVEHPPRLRSDRRHQIVTVSTVVAAALLVGFGWSGMSHPAPPGGVTLEVCAQVSQ